jgi:hypothetical protein
MTDFEELILPYFADTTYDQGVEELEMAFADHPDEEARALLALNEMIRVARSGDAAVMGVAQRVSISFAKTPQEFGAELERILRGYETRIASRG